MNLINKDFLNPIQKILDITDEFPDETKCPIRREIIENNLIKNLGLMKED